MLETIIWMAAFMATVPLSVASSRWRIGVQPTGVFVPEEIQACASLAADATLRVPKGLVSAMSNAERKNLVRDVEDNKPVSYSPQLTWTRQDWDRLAPELVEAYRERKQFEGLSWANLVHGPDGELRWSRAAPSNWRALWLIATASLGGYATALATQDGRISLLLGIVALITVLAGFHLALVDGATMFVDMPICWAATFGSAALITLNALLYPDAWVNAKLGLVVLAAAVLTMFIPALVYKLLTSSSGLGGGDFRVLGLVIAAPAAIAGKTIQDGIAVGLYGLIIACLMSVIYIVVRTAVSKVSLRSPIALVPFLATGWVVAYFMWGIN